MLHQFLLTASKQIQADRKQTLETSHHERGLQLLVLVFLLFSVLLLFLIWANIQAFKSKFLVIPSKSYLSTTLCCSSVTDNCSSPRCRRWHDQDHVVDFICGDEVLLLFQEVLQI